MQCNQRSTYALPTGEVSLRMSAKILLVDDSNTSLLMLEMLFKQHTEHSVILARNGAEAVARAISDHPDMILMDVVMPKMDGFEACRQIREQESLQGVPIILVTSRGEPCNVESGFESGCNDYLTKPINAGELIELVNEYLAESSSK
jgi:CheY-like chemotaxis protein